MANEFFGFADLIEQFSNDEPFSYERPLGKAQYSDDGVEIPRVATREEVTGAFVPFSNRQLMYSLNGAYTTDDRQFFTQSDLELNGYIYANGGRYKIDRLSDYDEWTDARIYYCRRVDNG